MTTIPQSKNTPRDHEPGLYRRAAEKEVTPFGGAAPLPGRGSAAMASLRKKDARPEPFVMHRTHGCCAELSRRCKGMPWVPQHPAGSPHGTHGIPGRDAGAQIC
jgi:hypothetical protein